jgi:quercetin dioxygenase-like cupin family protein
MSIAHAASGEPIDISPLRERLGDAVSTTLVRADHIEVFRLVLPAGKWLQEHQAAGSITIQCLEGVVELVAHGRTQTMRAGTLVYLDDARPHAVRTLEDASLLITMLLHRA